MPVISEQERSYSLRILLKGHKLMKPRIWFCRPHAVVFASLVCVVRAESDVGFEIFRYASIVFLVCMSGLFSGLTLGLLGLDTNQLEIVASAGSDEERRYARQILPVRRSGNLLLCTLLLGNVAVNALLSILLADLTNGLVGFIVSTAVIVIFGEIFPQAACSRHALLIGSKAIPIVKVIIVALYIIAKPISIFLDVVLGQEIGQTYSKEEFKELLQKTQALNEKEVAIMSGAIAFGDKLVRDVMTPIDQLFSVKASDKLDYRLMSEIFKSGYSRIPVWDDSKTNLVGLLYAKDLMLIVPANCTPVIAVVSFFNRDKIIKIFDDETLQMALKVFSSSKQQFAMVQTVDNTHEDRDPFYCYVGVITMEDLLEEILQQEILDEYDYYGAFMETLEVTVTREPESNHNQAAVGRPEYDYTHLRLLDASQGHNDLSAQEVKVVAAHLITSVPAFCKPGPHGQLSLEEVQELVKGCRVIDLVLDETEPADWLYNRNEEETFCTLILAGWMELLSGNDEIVSEKGPWEVIADRALTTARGEYKTDFSARQKSKKLRCLRISRDEYEQAFRFRRPATHSIDHTPPQVVAATESKEEANHFEDQPTMSMQRSSTTGLLSRSQASMEDTEDVNTRAGVPTASSTMAAGLLPRNQRKSRRTSSISSHHTGASADKDDIDVVVDPKV